MGLLNFVFFAVATEAQFDQDMQMFSIPVHSWLPRVVITFQLLSVVVNVLLILARSLSARACPYFSQYGSGAWWRYLLADMYVHIDIISTLPSFFLLPLGLWHYNLLWLSLLRFFQMAAIRAESEGKGWPAIHTCWSIIGDEHHLLVAVCIYAFIPWFLFSGLYFVANENNDNSVWTAAEYSGEPWQRFKSIPSSMFFVLINLCAEEPLADDFKRSYQRTLIVLVCWIGVPMFGLPTGFLGASFMKIASKESLPEASGHQVAQTSDNTFGSNPVWGAVTFVLSFGSVVTYFYQTAGATAFLGVPIHINDVSFVVVDGAVSTLFALEWLLRVRYGGFHYMSSLLGIIDLASWFPGACHAALFAAGVEIVDLRPPDYKQIEIGDWLLAACVLRVFKLERFTNAFCDLKGILWQQSDLLKATGAVTLFIWILFSSLLYFTEHQSTDPDVRVNYASVARALWSELINLHGEWVWCDYSAIGKVCCTFVAFVSVGIFIVPVIICGEGYQAKLQTDLNMESIDCLPWQARCCPSEVGFQQQLYFMLYSHVRPRPRQYNACYLCFCTMSVLLSCVATVSTVVLTSAVFDPINCKDNSDCIHAGQLIVRPEWAALAWLCYVVDCVATFFFFVEFLLRLGALRWRHICSFHGVCDILSLVSFVGTLPGWRASAIFPDYSQQNYILEALVPLRLLRLFLLEAYIPWLHILGNVVCVSRKPLMKSGYVLVCLWYAFATLLYLFEHNGPRKHNENEMNMAVRFRDVLTGLQYALVHLTGDYPITEYTLASKVTHFFALIFGMFVVAAFTGIFSSGFVHYLKLHRALERDQTSPTSRPVIILNSLSNLSPSSSSPQPLSINSPQLFGSGQSCSSLHARARDLLDVEHPRGRWFLRLANWSLGLNLIGTLIDSIPESDVYPILDMTLEVNEMLTGTVFIIEYLLMLMAADSLCLALRRRTVDLVCLLPTLSRFAISMEHGRWRGKHGFESVIICCAVFRVVRILNFPYVRSQRVKVWSAISAALRNLAAPAVLAVTMWVTFAAAFRWTEGAYDGPEKEHMASILDAMYWTAIYFTGEWANVDFSIGGSRMCIVMCLFGIALVAIPTGLVMEAVTSVMEESAEENKRLQESHSL